MRLRIVTTCLLCFFAGIAFAQDFKSYESGICIFKLQGCELTPPVERAILFGCSRIFDTYKQTFGFDYADDYRITVTIFADKDNFIEYQKNQGKKSLADVAYYSVRFRETVVYWRTYSEKTRDAKNMVSSVFHEANHMLLMTRSPWVPLWINEGLSEYFEELNVFGENKRVYLDKHSQRWLKHWTKNGFPIELDTYLKLTEDQWHKFNSQVKGCSAGYIIGYSLVYFMMSRSSTEQVLKELLWEFKSRGKKADSMKIIDKHYPGGFEKFERSWLKWIPDARPYRPLRALRTHAQTANSNPPVNATGKTSSPNEK